VAAEIERELGVESELVGGSGGIFEVRLGDSVIFSNHRAGGVPDPAIVIEAVRRVKAAE
jgi:predicted Rdx family selenoprotein